MKQRKFYNGFRFFIKGLKECKTQVLISLQVIIVLTWVISTVLYFVEHFAQPEVYSNYWYNLLWSFVTFLDNPPDHVIVHDPITGFGKVLWATICLLKIALFAVPTGLIANGFDQAMQDEKRKEELEGYTKNIKRRFKRFRSLVLNDYLEANPEMNPQQLTKRYQVYKQVEFADLQLSLGMSMKDIVDMIKAHPELRLKNIAQAVSDEQEGGKEDKYVVEWAPLNRSYGYFINRGSNVTIVSPSSVTDYGIGWFCYYIAKFGGFNYISKDIEADVTDPDSFYYLPNPPQVDGQPREFYEQDPTTYDDELELLDKKQQCRDDYFADLKQVSGDGKWVIVCCSRVKNSRNKWDISLVDNNRKGNMPTVDDTDGLARLVEELNRLFHLPPYDADHAREVAHNVLYPADRRNITKIIRKDLGAPNTNTVVMNLDSHMINFDIRRSLSAYLIAGAIRKTISPESRITDEDIRKFAQRGSGFVD